MRGLLIAAALLLASAGTSMASTINVSFSGTVGASAGSIQGVTLTQGDSFSGSFSFDADALAPSSNNTVSGFPNAIYTNPGAVQLQLKVGAQTFSYNGSSTSGVTLAKDLAHQEFAISSTDTPFSQITIDVLGSNLYTDPQNLNSLSFDNLPGELHFNDLFGGSFNSASLHASSISVGVATTPVPATLPLFLSAIASFGWFAMRRWRADAKPALASVAA